MYFFGSFAFDQLQHVSTVPTRNDGLPNSILQRKEPKNNGSPPKRSRGEENSQEVTFWFAIVSSLDTSRRIFHRENDDLRRQNLQLQRCVDLREPSDTQNSNGKRPMAGSHGYAFCDIGWLQFMAGLPSTVLGPTPAQG